MLAPSFPSRLIQEMFEETVRRESLEITRDPNHILYKEPEPIPSGRRYENSTCKKKNSTLRDLCNTLSDKRHNNGYSNVKHGAYVSFEVFTLFLSIVPLCFSALRISKENIVLLTSNTLGMRADGVIHLKIKCMII